MAPRRTQKSLSQPSTSSGITHSDDEEDHDPRAQSQRSQGHNKSLSNQEHAHHVASAVRYILAADQSKVPITRSAISKAIECPGANFRSVMNTVEQVLRDVFGYNLVNLKTNKEKSNASAGKFILVNRIPNNLPHLSFNNEVKDHHILLFLVLSHIFMNGESCSEASIIKFLTRLDIIIEGNMNHEVFGNVLNLITVEYVKEKYLDVQETKNTECPEKEFSWGQRAKSELSVRRVMEFVCRVFDDREMQTWPQQYERMRQLEQDQEDAEDNGVDENAEA